MRAKPVQAPACGLSVTADQQPCRAIPASPTQHQPREPRPGRPPLAAAPAHHPRQEPPSRPQVSRAGGSAGARTALTLVWRAHRPPARVTLGKRETLSPEGAPPKSHRDHGGGWSQPWAPCRRERGWGTLSQASHYPGLAGACPSAGPRHGPRRGGSQACLRCPLSHDPSNALSSWGPRPSPVMWGQQPPAEGPSLLVCVYSIRGAATTQQALCPGESLWRPLDLTGRPGLRAAGQRTGQQGDGSPSRASRSGWEIREGLLEEVPGPEAWGMTGVCSRQQQTCKWEQPSHGTGWAPQPWPGLQAAHRDHSGEPALPS